MSKTHQLGYAMYITKSRWNEDRVEERKAFVLKQLNRLAFFLWLKPPTSPTFIIHKPGSSFDDPLAMIGSVGVKENLPHKWPHALSHALMYLRGFKPQLDHPCLTHLGPHK